MLPKDGAAGEISIAVDLSRGTPYFQLPMRMNV
jgi:hypothetical protein